MAFDHMARTPDVVIVDVYKDVANYNILDRFLTRVQAPRDRDVVHAEHCPWSE
jgi:hypothetical protein